jgi:L-2,4-diaminobutyrate decarboxylase
MSSLDDAFSPDRFRQHGHALIDLLADHLTRAQANAFPSVMPKGTPAEMCAKFPAEFTPSGDNDVINHIARALGASTSLHTPHFVGHQVATPLPDAALCDLVAAFTNNGMAVFEMGPAASAMERAVLGFLAKQLGFSSTSGGVLTSGGSLGNLTALLAARQRSMDTWRQGLKGGPQMCVFVGENMHYSVARACRMLGLGDVGVVVVELDDQQRMKPFALASQIAVRKLQGQRPMAIVASAGSTAVGAFDPLEQIADIAQREGMWLHVDGAHGASLSLSSRRKHLLKGIERADSVVWDAHKMLLMPALITAVLFKDANAGAAAFAQEAGYLFDDAGNPDDNWWDIGRRTVECTKRMMALKLYACLRAYGTALFQEHVDRVCDRAQALAAKARERGLEVLVEPQCDIVVFRPKGMDGGKVAALRKRILDDGRFYLVQLHRKDGMWLRTTILNPLTTEQDLDELLSELP